LGVGVLPKAGIAAPTVGPSRLRAASLAALVLSPTIVATPSTRHITLAFTGDTLLHQPVVRAATTAAGGYDFSPMFADVAPVLSAADLAVCHLETPIAPPSEPLSTYPLYGVPAEIAGGLAAAGYDRCSTASNHTMDRGVAGIDATVTALAAAGLGQSGMARTPEEAIPAIFEVNGVRVAHLSYTFGFNGLRLPPDEPWRSNTIDPATIIAAAHDARLRGAEVVIASLHWGTEGSSNVTRFQRSVAEAITASGEVDLIVGHHAHVVQQIEQINGRWVVFGLGNILSNLPTSPQWPASTQDGVIVTFGLTVDARGTVAVEQPIAFPTWVDREHGFVVRLVQADLMDATLPLRLQTQLAASLRRTNDVIGPFVARP
jgi:poly-gamma-glutamate synthesis protein (capsule biosynthesis protein)